MALTERADNQTRIGGNRSGAGVGIIAVDTPSGQVSAVCLLDTAGTEHFLWFTTNNTLMTGTRAALATPNAAADSSHIIVGGQTTV